MSKLSRLIGMASKALDKTSGSSSAGGTSGASGDWRSVVRSAADAITGDGRSQGAAPAQGNTSPGSRGAYTPPPAPAASASHGRYTPPPAPGSVGALAPADRQAIARYDYLMQTADPQQVEQIHREAFGRLTPEQRAHVQARMAAELPAHEQPRSADPTDLARAAARTEASRPGMLKGLLARASGRGGTGSGMGRVAGGAAIGAGAGILGAVAGGAIVTAVAGPLLAQAAGLGVDFDALAQGVDLDALAQGADLEGLAGDALSGVGDHVSGLGEQVSGFGENLGGFEIPGLGDIFGR
ncbi:hypothetical protein SAMN05216488_1557 [Microbacterium sp. LKL04]|uniref:cation-transporting ATPase n=1 Tax=Microbacterium sp. LKL04 TaxID=912630 RepID=UPI000875E3BF|nr:cation-transporting ATPase [Microbacterium sp. LKL04]SCY37024.1 hypothetical protein SAMN05216488_1557 [Microbacterium sp. LKL04]